MDNRYQGENLIFLISPPRSGSTLLQRVLAGHPDIHTSAETWLMLHPIYGLAGSGLQAEYCAPWAKDGVEDFLTHYTDGTHVYDDAIRAWAQVIYGNALGRSNKRRFLDKTPRYYFIISELFRIFPSAKFLFLLRNPLAVLQSELSTYVKGKWTEIAAFQPDLLLAPSRLLAGIERLGANAITIHYEKFVSAPEETLAPVCDYLGISFRPEVLDYAQTPEPMGRMKDHVGVRQHSRPSTQSLDKWKQMATDAQSRHFASSYLHALGPDVINGLGYSFEELSRHFPTSNCDAELSVFPWNVAIRPEKEWNFRDWFSATRFSTFQRRGRVLGTLALARRTVAHLRKQLWRALQKRSA